jgi:hypothetical protein
MWTSSGAAKSKQATSSALIWGRSDNCLDREIGLAIAPSVLRWLRTLNRDVDEITEEGFADLDRDRPQQNKKEHTNGTRR